MYLAKHLEKAVEITLAELKALCFQPLLHGTEEEIRFEAALGCCKVMRS